MDDVRALQDASLHDRQEREQLRCALTAEADKARNLQLRLDCEVELNAKLQEALAQRRAAQRAEVAAAVLYQKTLLELTKLQQQHLESQQEHQSEAEALRSQLDAARRETAERGSDLAAERSGRAAAVAELTQQLQERKVAAAAEVAALHESYGDRLSLLEDFKNQLLADKAAAEDRWARERTALKAQQAESAAAAAVAAAAAAEAANGGGGEAAWKARLVRLRTEADGLRRERDAMRAVLRAAGITPPSTAMPPGTDTSGSAAGAIAAGGCGPSVAPAAVPPPLGGGQEGPGRKRPAGDAAGQAPPNMPQRPQHNHHHQRPNSHPLQPQQPPYPQHPSMYAQQQQPQQPHLTNQGLHGADRSAARAPLRGGGIGSVPRMALGGPMGRPMGPGGAGMGVGPGTPYMHQQQQQHGAQGLQPQPNTMLGGGGGAEGGAAVAAAGAPLQPGLPGARR